jgi:acyl-CoA synthetase (AMP-forming)/AMP-acid ligase II
MTAPPIPQITLEQFENEYRDRHLIHGAIDYWAARKPSEPAIINATRGTVTTWSDLQRGSMALAGELKRMGFRKGDFLATSLPFLTEHVLLEYACFRLGVIHAPLDLRLQPAEVMRCLGLIRARGYAFLGKTPAADFAALGEAVRQRCDFIEHFIQYSPPPETIGGAVSFADVAARAMSSPSPVVNEASPEEGAQVIFTTGSTGSPKPALLSHRGIACQNLCLGSAFGFAPGLRVLNNLPASHVGGQAELLMTSLFTGSVCVLLEIFDAAKSLAAIEEHGVSLLGQIPAMFQMEWRTADYAKRNLSSLQAAVYGGQSVPRPFLEKMLTMAPRIGTGLGLTESSGFCTYTALTGNVDEVAASIGWAMPVYPLTIRKPMENGRAGAELPPGEIGHICFSGPQNFLGYVNDPDSTARALSSDGFLYTGDMGYAAPDGLHFSGRAKWVIKPAGYQVFPGDVEHHFSELESQVASVGVIGCEHRIWSEGIIAFVEKKPGAELSESDLRRHARSLTSYMRPLHYVILEPGAMPLNRTAKVDVIRLQEMAREEVARLRERGRWDGAEESLEP